MPLVNLPDGTQANFPDNMSQDQIVSVIKSHLESKSTPPQTQLPQSVQLSQNAQPQQVPLTSNPGLQAAQQATRPIAAFVGGAGEGLGNVASMATGRDLNLRPQGQLEQDVLTNPGIASVGKAIGTVAPAFAGSTGVSAVARGTAANMLGQGAIGATMAGPDNRIAGFVGGSIIPTVVQKTLGGIGKYLAANAAQDTKVLSEIKALNTVQGTSDDVYTATNREFDKFKSVPGQVNTNSAQDAISNTIKLVGPKLSATQTTAIQELQDDVKNAGNLNDLHEARKAFTRDFKRVFLTGDNAVYGKSRQAVLNLKNEIETNLQVNASNLGVLKEYQTANTLYKQSLEADLFNNALKKAQYPEGGYDFLKFNKSLQNLKADQVTKLSPETRQAVTGIQNTLKEANHIYGIRTKELWITPILSTLKALLINPATKGLLEKAGTPGGEKISSDLTKAIFNSIQAQHAGVFSTPNEPTE